MPFKDIHFYSMTIVFQPGPRVKKHESKLDRKRILIQMVFLGAVIPENSHNIPHWKERTIKQNATFKP